MNNFIYFWFRRDLRIEDNHGLFEALNSGYKVLPIFIFDKDILDKLTNPEDSRVSFIHKTIKSLKERLQNEFHSDLVVHYGISRDIWKNLLTDEKCVGVYTNEDYEPTAIQRDKEVEKIANSLEKEFKLFKDQVIFAKDEVVKDDGKPYTVYTPYMKKWKFRLASNPIERYPSEEKLSNLKKVNQEELIPLNKMGFTQSNIEYPPAEIEKGRIKNYADKRTFPVY